MTKPSSRRKKGAALAAAVLTLAGAGAAFAYWTSTGSGTGTATTGDNVTFEITSLPGVGMIAPGADGQTVAFTVTNPGAATLYLTEVTVSIATADGTAWEPTGACLIADYTATISSAPAAGEIAAGGSVDGVATVTLANTAVNQDDCQGQDVPLYFVAS